jgi:hypothetical protein
MYKLSMFGVVWCRITITSGPLRTARTAARAAGRSDLSDHSALCSNSTHKARGTQRLHAGSMDGRGDDVSTGTKQSPHSHALIAPPAVKIYVACECVILMRAALGWP